MPFWPRKRKEERAPQPANRLPGGAPPEPPSDASAPPCKRFLTRPVEHYRSYVQAAKTYLKQHGRSRDGWLFLKPYRAKDHGEYFSLMYNVLNLLAVMGGRIDVLRVTREPAKGACRVRVRLTNDGETAWLHQSRASGWVTLSLFRGAPGGEGRVEANSRNRLPRTLEAGQSCEMEALYFLPPGGWDGEWRLDLINEGLFWFNVNAPVEIGGREAT